MSIAYGNLLAIPLPPYYVVIALGSKDLGSYESTYTIFCPDVLVYVRNSFLSVCVDSRVGNLRRKGFADTLDRQRLQHERSTKLAAQIPGLWVSFMNVSIPSRM